MVGYAFHGRVNSTLRSIVAETGEDKTVLREKTFLAPYGGSESVWSLHNTMVTLLCKEELYFLFIFSNELLVKFVPMKKWNWPDACIERF